MRPKMTMLTERFDAALAFANDRHRDQIRKGTGVPYVSHLLSTAALVLEAGGTETEAVAALLHDTLEDGKATYEELADRFGGEVADIVRECSDSEGGDPKPPWQDRKQAYVASLSDHSPSALLVSCADKLHNARSILSDYRNLGNELWKRFNPDADPLWYYRSLADRFAELRPGRLADELDRVVTELEELAAPTN